MSWLTNEIIKRKIKLNANDDTRKAFLGVYPIDSLPSAVTVYPCFLVVNTQSHNLPGEHWIAIFVDKQKRGEIFDSLALPPSLLLMRWMNRFCRTWKRNLLSYQHPLSATCGSFVLYFILHRLSVSYLKNITNSFTRDLHVNDEIVVSFFNTLK